MSWQEETAKTSVQLYHEGRDALWRAVLAQERPRNAAYTQALEQAGWITQGGRPMFRRGTGRGALPYSPLLNQLHLPDFQPDQLDTQELPAIGRDMDWEEGTT